MGLFDEFKHRYRNGSPILRLIIVNVAIFIIGLLVQIFLKIVYPEGMTKMVGESMVRIGPGGMFFEWVGVPLGTNWMELLYKPWTLITYMFIHADFWHILFNMLFLYWFGEVVVNLIGQSKIFALYLYGGLTGAFIAMLLALTPLVEHSPLVGASGAVYAIMLAAVTLSPNYEFRLFFLGSVKIKYIVLVKVIIDLSYIALGKNAGGHICHFGGALFGWFFISQLRNGFDMSKGLNKLIDSISAIFSRKPRIKVVHRSSKQNTKRENGPAQDRQQKVDEILDKINKSGYSSLSEEEKEFLFKASKE